MLLANFTFTTNVPIKIFLQNKSDEDDNMPDPVYTIRGPAFQRRRLQERDRESVILFTVNRKSRGVKIEKKPRDCTFHLVRKEKNKEL